MKEQWMNDLHHQMGDFGKKAPEGLLDDIKNEMARRGVMPSPKQKAKVTPMWVRSAAVAAAIAVPIFGLYVWQNLHSEEPVVTSVKQSNGNVLSQKGSEEENVGDVIRHFVENVRTASDKITRKYGSQRSFAASYKETNTESEMLSAVTSEKFADNTPSNKAVLNDTSKEEQRPVFTIQETAVENQPAQRNVRKAVRVSKLKSSAYSFGFSYSGQIGLNSLKSPDGSSEMPYASDPYFSPCHEHYFTDDLDANLFITSLSQEPTWHHNFPVKVGISFRYALDKKWGIQSGVNYSYLSSDCKEFLAGKQQKLHYVGIPVSVSYNLWQNKHVNLYFTAGGEVEKLVKGKAVVENQDVLGEMTKTETVTESSPQFSMNISAGLEYRIVDAVGLYVEPGVSHYINNGSEVENFYKDKPTNFNLNLGLRVNINK